MTRTLHLPTIAAALLALLTIFLIHYAYIGMTTPPIEGDSIAYHIPNAQIIWSGGLLHPKHILHYYPSIGEIILSFFIFLHIPLNTYNILAIILLFFAARRLAAQYSLSPPTALIFAASICMLPLTMRWVSSQVIDLWLAVFFIWSLALIQKKPHTRRQYLLLGTAMGLLIGTKNSGPAWAAILLLIYHRAFTTKRNLTTILWWGIPAGFLGGFWYIRNALLTGNPLYPQKILSLPGAPHWNILEWNVGQIALSHPIPMTNALISEVTLWVIALIIPAFYLYKQKHTQTPLISLITLGYANLIIFLFLPTTPAYNIMVSSFRYAYPAFIPLILSMFMIAKEYKKEELLSLAALTTVYMLPLPAYHPKLLFVVIPTVLLLFHRLRNRGRQ